MKRMRSEYDYQHTIIGGAGSITADADDLTRALGPPESRFNNNDRDGYTLMWVYTAEDGQVFTISGFNATRNIGDVNTRYIEYKNWNIRGNNGQPTSSASAEIQKLLQKYELF